MFFVWRHIFEKLLPGVNFLKLGLYAPSAKLLTAFSGEEVECQKICRRTSSPENAVKKWAPGAIAERKFQKIDPRSQSYKTTLALITSKLM